MFKLDTFQNSTILSNYMDQVNKDLGATTKKAGSFGQAGDLNLSLAQMFDN